MIDELEAHLYPKWQRTILPALIEVQKYLADELEDLYEEIKKIIKAPVTVPA